MKNQNNLSEGEKVKKIIFSGFLKKRTFLGITFVFMWFNCLPQDTTSSGSWIYKGNKTIIQGDRVVNIFEDHRKNIWVISSDKTGEDVNKGKINLFDGNKWNYFNDEPEIFNQEFYSSAISLNISPSSIYCRALGTASGAHLLFIRKDGTRCLFDGNKWTCFSDELLNEFCRKEYNLSKKEKIINIIEDKVNRIWIETTKGLLLCENGSFRRFMPDLDFSDKSAIYQYSYNIFTPDLYLSCTKGIFHFEQDQFQLCKSVPGWVVYMPAYSDSNTVCFWVFQSANKPNILLKLSNGTWNEFKFKKNFGLPKLKMGPGQCLWFVGNLVIGYIDPKNQMVFLPVDQNKMFPSVFYALHIFDEIVFTQKGEAWISSVVNLDITVYRWEKAGGFFVYWNGTTLTYYNKEDDLPRLRKMYIRGLLVDKKDNFWVITGFPLIDIFATDKTAAIIRQKNNSWDVFDISNGFTARFYTKIVEDSHGRIWIGSSDNGIFLYEYTH